LSIYYGTIFSQIFLNILGTFLLVGIVNFWLLLPIVLLGIYFYKLSQIYIVTSRSVTRLESTSKDFFNNNKKKYFLFIKNTHTARSPVFTHVSSSLSGLSTLRAHQCEHIFQQVFNHCQNVHSSAYYLYLATSRWFAIQMDFINLFYIACVTYTCTALQGS